MMITDDRCHCSLLYSFTIIGKSQPMYLSSFTAWFTILDQSGSVHRRCGSQTSRTATRALVMATLSLFGFFTKPNRFFWSSSNSDVEDLTVEIMISGLSWPWNSSTVPIFGSGNPNDSNTILKYLICK